MANNLGNKVAETELRNRIDRLQKELNKARQSLKKLQGKIDDKHNDDNDDDEYEDIQGELETTLNQVAIQPPPGKKGYLFRWNDRSLGWLGGGGGTRWSLSFVVVEDGRVSIYSSHYETTAVEYSLSLRGCTIRDDGWKLNHRFKSKRNYRKEKREDEDGVVVSDQLPPFDEPGAYFFLFSICERSIIDETATSSEGLAASDGNRSDTSSEGLAASDGKRRSDTVAVVDEEVPPLLRFSTTSMAEKNQWIHLLAEMCAYCETDVYLQHEAERIKEEQKRREQEERMRSAMPEAKEGTLPPLVFVPPIQAQTLKSGRRPSLKVKKNAEHYKSKTNLRDADQRDKKSHGYPPSKPMHRDVEYSYLSSKRVEPVHYRGLLNLGIIILVLANLRLALSTIQLYGFLFDPASILPRLEDLVLLQQNVPLYAGLLLILAFVLNTVAIERMLCRKWLPETAGILLHNVNALSALVVPTYIVWNMIDDPRAGGILIVVAICTWLKLLSYIHANQDYRLSSYEQYMAGLALIKGGLSEAELDMVYPQNVTVLNMLYFCCAPTLTYQMVFPRTERIRPIVVFSLLVRLFIGGELLLFLSAQTIRPALDSVVQELQESGGTYTVDIMVKYWLRLAIGSTYSWLLAFYCLFHLAMNLSAELLRFGDRVFYKDWWNASELASFWRLWNLPVHYWMVRHMYFPVLRMGFSKAFASTFSFFFSAIMHEFAISVPFRMIRPWSFLAIFSQVPLVMLTQRVDKIFPGSSIGNVVFWISFCVVGQPMAVLLYTIDYEYIKRNSEPNICMATSN